MDDIRTITSINPAEYSLFVGMDAHKRRTNVVVLDRADVVCVKSFPSDPKGIVGYFRKHYGQRRIAFVYEAGPTGYGLYDELVGSGQVCLVVAPSLVPRKPNERVRNNRLDAGKLATGLRGGTLKGIRVPSERDRRLRHLVQLRNVYVQKCSNMKLRIKSLLLQEGIPFPGSESGSRWTKSAWEAMQTAPVYEKVRFKLNSLLSSITFFRAEAHKVTQEIGRYCESDADLAESVRFLCSIPGIGPTVAAALLARIGDWRQLKSPREIGSFLGLTPWEDSTGDDVHRGSITRLGHSRTRSMLIESSWTAIRHDPELRAVYLRIYRRHPKHLAASERSI